MHIVVSALSCPVLLRIVYVVVALLRRITAIAYA